MSEGANSPPRAPAMAAPVALITGASSGIGEAMARQLAAEGHSLVLVARNRAALTALADTLVAQYGRRVHVVVADLTEEAAAESVVRSVRAQGMTVHILINNAGYGTSGPHVQNALRDESGMIELNIHALVRLSRLLLPDMIRRNHGQILNVASVAAYMPGPWMAVYFATKAFVLSYSQALSEELRGTGVTVTALCPGPTRSGFADRAGMGTSSLFRAGKHLPDAVTVADFGLKAMRRGRSVAVHGLGNRLMLRLVGLLPRAWVLPVVARINTHEG